VAGAGAEHEVGERVFTLAARVERVLEVLPEVLLEDARRVVAVIDARARDEAAREFGDARV
jgi:hypothetical protein